MNSQIDNNMTVLPSPPTPITDGLFLFKKKKLSWIKKNGKNGQLRTSP